MSGLHALRKPPLLTETRRTRKALQHARQIRAPRPALIVHACRHYLRTVGGDFIEPITCRLIQGKLPILFSLAVSYQQRPIVFPLPLEFYLQKISINRLYAVIPFHSFCRWAHRPSGQHRLPYRPLALLLPKREVASPPQVRVLLLLETMVV